MTKTQNPLKIATPPKNNLAKYKTKLDSVKNGQDRASTARRRVPPQASPSTKKFRCDSTAPTCTPPREKIAAIGREDPHIRVGPPGLGSSGRVLSQYLVLLKTPLRADVLGERLTQGRRHGGPKSHRTRWPPARHPPDCSNHGGRKTNRGASRDGALSPLLLTRRAHNCGAAKAYHHELIR